MFLYFPKEMIYNLYSYMFHLSTEKKIFFKEREAVV